MRILAILVLCFLPSGAWALSCAAPNLARSLDHALQSGVPLRVVAGELQMVQSGKKPLPRKGGRAVYGLKGTELSRGGWLIDLDEEVRVETRCAASWCGRAPGAKTRGVFLMTTEPAGALLLRIGPCGGTVFPFPSPEQSEALVRCARAGKCTEADIGLFRPGRK